MQVTSAILFRVAFQSLHTVIKKALSQITNMESTSSVQSLLTEGNFPVAPPLVAGLVTLQLFQNCFPRISWYFPYVYSCLVL